MGDKINGNFFNQIDDKYRMALYVITRFNPVVDDYNWYRHYVINIFTKYLKHESDAQLGYEEDKAVFQYYMYDKRVESVKAFLYCEFEHFIHLLGENGYKSSRREFGVSNLANTPQAIKHLIKMNKINRFETDLSKWMLFIQKQRKIRQRPFAPKKLEEPKEEVNPPQPVDYTESQNGGCLVFFTLTIGGIYLLINIWS